MKKRCHAITAFAFAVCFLSTLTSLHAADHLVFEPAEGKSNGKHIVLISGDEEYRTEESCPMLGKILSQTHGFKCTVLFAIDKETGGINPYQIDNIPGTEALNDADLMILATRWRVLPDDQLDPILNFINAGKPIIAYRTATHAFKSGHYGDYDWANFGINVVGENWHSHHGKHKVEGGRAVIVEDNANHPILNDVADIYTPSDIYGVVHLDESAATVLLRGMVIQHLDPAAPPVEAKNDPMMPLAWLKPYEAPSGKTGQCVATTAGAAVDFRSEDLRRLIVNASYFLTGMDVPKSADVSFIDPYVPSFYGFETGKLYRERDLRVEEFDLGSSATVFTPKGSFAPIAH
ncbi:ThuA domain-containing protein [Rhodopirellula europaea]|uniref:Signal peptide and transmembrane prediction n=1 Tax=Rhodopirellula europaea 6C TaxID=1263867 RepID=M2AN31_9BACT|nr:ThuA domain-containing protein [Rhodopirellula europaea]EMB18515.1 signal peptide and transmembrane prediction [Rhodopirellula europaea 6C]